MLSLEVKKSNKKSNFFERHLEDISRNLEGKMISKENQIPKLEELPRSDDIGGFIVRKPIYYSVDIANNPDMKRTIEKFEKDALKSFYLYAKSKNLCHTNKNYKTIKKEFVKKSINSSIVELRYTAIKQHENLIKAFKREKVNYRFFMNEKGKTDEVFATDTGKLVVFNQKPKFISAKFTNSNRRGEEKSAHLLMEGQLNIPVVNLKDDNGQTLHFEGGDCRKMPGFNVWFLGGGFRNGNNMGLPKDILFKNATAFAKTSDSIVLPILLKDPEFYHLDCCFLPLGKDSDGKPWAVIYEGEPNKPSIEKESLNLIRKLYGNNHLIKITRKEAKNFATNAVVVRKSDSQKLIFVHKNAYEKETKSKLESLDYKIVEVKYDAMHKSGGSIRCSSQEIPESLLNHVMHPSDDFRIEQMGKTLKKLDRRIGLGVNKKLVLKPINKLS